jgi:hypothetical protein
MQSRLSELFSGKSQFCSFGVSQKSPSFWNYIVHIHQAITTDELFNAEHEQDPFLCSNTKRARTHPHRHRGFPLFSELKRYHIQCEKCIILKHFKCLVGWCFWDAIHANYHAVALHWHSKWENRHKNTKHAQKPWHKNLPEKPLKLWILSCNSSWRNIASVTLGKVNIINARIRSAPRTIVQCLLVTACNLSHFFVGGPLRYSVFHLCKNSIHMWTCLIKKTLNFTRFLSDPEPESTPFCLLSPNEHSPTFSKLHYN